jgi:transposase
MELLSVIRRWHFRDHLSIREISRRTNLSRNTVRRYLRSDSEEPRFNLPDRPSKLDPHADNLSHMLRQEAGVNSRAIVALTHMWNGPTGKVFVEV